MRSSARAKQRKDKGGDDVNGTYRFCIESTNLLPNWIAISHRIDSTSVPCMTLYMMSTVSSAVVRTNTANSVSAMAVESIMAEAPR